MNKIIKVKQIEDNKLKETFSGLEQVKHDTGVKEFTVFPGAYRAAYIRKTISGEYRTGLSEKEIEHYQNLLGHDLSSRSNYWKRKIVIQEPFKERMFNLEVPLDYLDWKAAIASDLIAPSYTALKDNKQKYRGCYYYCADEEEEANRNERKQTLKDEIYEKTIAIRNDKEKLIMVGFALGLIMNDTYDTNRLYKQIVEWRETLTTLEKIEVAVSTINTDPITLQANFYFIKGLKKQVLKLDHEDNKYTFDSTILGYSKEDALKFLKEIENSAVLANLIKTVKRLKS